MFDDEVQIQQKLFNSLLVEHSALLKKEAEPNRGAMNGFVELLDNFVGIAASALATSKAEAIEDRQRFESILEEYKKTQETLRRQQENVADDFNLLEVLQLTYKETRHSMVLAWLLDRDLSRHGTHAQGSLGFQLFLKELGLPMHYSATDYRVRREVVGDDSIVDLEIGCRSEFLIHIENKIWSGEGLDQTDREWADLQRRAAEFGLDPKVKDSSVHAFFLTPKGTKPKNLQFKPISWGRIARILEQFAEQAKPADVKLFAAHYARSLRRFIVSDNFDKGGVDAETTTE